MKISATPLEGVFLVEPQVFADKRGFFMETYNRDKYAGAGIAKEFVQDNFSHSTSGVLRGMHYQLGHAQAKLVYVIRGEVFDVVIDIRRGSPSFGKWYGVTLSCENKRQLFVPEGFAHGFCVMSAEADFVYKCSDFYSPADENGILWSDTDIGIDWPLKNPVLSDKDALYKPLKDIDRRLLPVYKPL